MAVKKSISDNPSPISELSAKERALQAEIDQLKDFVVHGPERERQAEEERLQTLPPLSEIEDRKREKEFMKRLSRGEIANEKRAQASNGLLLVLLALAIAAIGAWIYQVVQG